MPAGAVEHEDGVGTGRHGAGDLGEVHVHGLGIGVSQDHPGGDPAPGAGGAEDAAPFVARVAGRARVGAGPCPFPRQSSLLPGARFIFASFILTPMESDFRQKGNPKNESGHRAFGISPRGIRSRRPVPSPVRGERGKYVSCHDAPALPQGPGLSHMKVLRLFRVHVARPDPAPSGSQPCPAGISK